MSGRIEDVKPKSVVARLRAWLILKLVGKYPIANVWVNGSIHFPDPNGAIVAHCTIHVTKDSEVVIRGPDRRVTIER